MRNILMDKKYSGFIWHLLFAGLFIGLSLFFIERTQGVTWYLISTALRIVFGVAIIVTAAKLFKKQPIEILSFKNVKRAFGVGAVFLIFFLYYVITVSSGIGKITGLTVGIFLTKVILQQAATGFYEELNYRFLLLKGLDSTRNNVGIRILYVMVSSILFGLLHCVTGWDTYTFLRTGAIGFAFAVIFVKSGNIVVPMIFHFLYDIIAKMTEYIEWNHNPFYDSMCSVFEIMLVIMFIISLVVLILPPRKDQG